MNRGRPKCEVAIPDGWKCWDENPPSRGEHIVRRCISDMEAEYSKTLPMKWRVAKPYTSYSLKYIWQPYLTYTTDLYNSRYTGTEEA